MSQLSLNVNDGLDQRVKERFRFLIRAVKFSKWLLDRKGTVLKDEPVLASDCDAKVELRDHKVLGLKKFNGFSFEGDYDQTMLGGNDIKIWRCEDPGEDRLVLHLHWQDSLVDCQVKVFEDDWVSSLNRMMSHGDDEILNQTEAQVMKDILAFYEVWDARHRAMMRDLLEEAGHLGLEL